MWDGVGGEEEEQWQGGGAIPSGVQGLFLALSSRITPGKAQGTIWGAWDKTEVSCPTCLSNP